MERLNDFSMIDSSVIAQAAREFGTPVYVYDEASIRARCKEAVSMPNSFGLTVRFAMKANSNRTVLKIIHDEGLHIDASSLNEVIRANLAGIPFQNIMLTTQEVPLGTQREELEGFLLAGLKYNACSLRQLNLIADFASKNNIEIGIRVHPGIGSGESATRNTGDDYACFGIHALDIAEALQIAENHGLKFKHIHVHIGSGADSLVWQQNIDLELSIIEANFPDATSVGFGGGLKVARMPYEKAANIEELGNYAKKRVQEFYEKTGRKLTVEIEPGTYIVANAGYAVTGVLDKKRTSRYNFIITDGGMEINARPLLYGSRHPFYIVSASGTEVKSSEFRDIDGDYEAVVAGRCCESGDCQTLDPDGHSVSRAIAEPDIGDYTVIGGTGAYCSTMTPFNYNSHTQIAELLYTTDGRLEIVRKPQTLMQILENEV